LADVVIGAVLVAGSRTPHVVTREMVRKMKAGSVIIDLAIDEGGCVETSRPTTIFDPTFVCENVTHYCVPNLTADMSCSASTAISQALLPYLIRIADDGVQQALLTCPDLRRGAYMYRGQCVNRNLAQACGVEHRPVEELLRATTQVAEAFRVP
jgi:alanine dehydrogenase